MFVFEEGTKEGEGDVNASAPTGRMRACSRCRFRRAFPAALRNEAPLIVLFPCCIAVGAKSVEINSDLEAIFTTLCVQWLVGALGGRRGVGPRRYRLHFLYLRERMHMYFAIFLTPPSIPNISVDLKNTAVNVFYSPLSSSTIK